MYFASVGIISIVTMEATYGDAHDAPVYRDVLLEEVPLKKKRRVHKDKAYDDEATFEKEFEKGLIPNTVPKDNSKRGFWRKKARKVYDDELRKKIRGMIEGIFGGLTTDNGMKTRFKLDRRRKKHALLLALSHNIRSYFRATVYKLINLLINFATTPINFATTPKY